MTHPIITSSDASGNLQTTANTGETAGQWARRHFGDLATAVAANEFDVGQELCTEWYDSNSEHHAHCTERNPGESANAFRLRHSADAATAMVDNPPAP